MTYATQFEYPIPPVILNALADLDEAAKDYAFVTDEGGHKSRERAYGRFMDRQRIAYASIAEWAERHLVSTPDSEAA